MPRLKYKFNYRADRFYLLTRRQQLRWIMNGPNPHLGESVPDYIERITLMDAKLSPEGARAISAIMRTAYEEVTRV